MKKIILLFLLLSAMQDFVKAQTTKSIVAREPKYTQGFLVLDGTLENIDYWRVFVLERTFNEQGLWTDAAVERIEMWDRNYYRVPSEYFVETAEHEYMYQVEGWSKTSGKVVDSGPTPLYGEGTPWLTGNRFVCNGTTYAWSITQTVHPSGCCVYHYELQGAGNGYIEPSAANPAGTVIPFYEYMFKSDYDDLNEDTPWCTYHGIDLGQPWSIEIGSEVFKVPDLPAGLYYYNKEGEQLNPNLGPIVGVQKTKGPWLGGLLLTEDVGQDWTGMPLVGAGSITQRFNDFSNIEDYMDAGAVDQLLTCVEVNGMQYDGSGDDPGEPWSDNCFDAIPAPEDTDGDGIPDLDSTLPDWYDCLQMNIAGDIVTFQVSNWNEGDQEVVGNFGHADMYDALGHFNQPSLTLPQGLNSITTGFADGKQATLFLDLKEKTQSAIPLSALVAFNIFPVPTIGNAYSVNIQSSATLEFEYQVMDMSGQVYYTCKYDVRKNHHADHAVQLKDATPAGMLIHTFTFADGSVKNILTTKQ